MKLLHTSDWHLGKSLYDFSLLEDQQHLIDELLRVITAEQIDAVLISGDIYDRPVPSSQAVQLYDYFLSQVVGHMGIPVLAIAGNHDSASRLEFGSSLYRTSGYHICGHVQKEIQRVTLRDNHGPVHFFLLPYLHPAEVRVLLDREIRTFDDAYRALLEHNRDRIPAEERCVILAHGFFSDLSRTETDREVLTSDSEINIGGMDIAHSGCFSPFDYAALGHLHAPQRVGSEQVRYSGSPLKYSLSEEHQHKSWTVVELREKGSVGVSTLPIQPLRDVRTISGAFGDLLEPASHENKQFEDYVFAEIQDSGILYPMEKLRTLFPHLLGLRFINEPEAQMPQIQVGGNLPRLSVEEHFCRFYQKVNGREIPPEHLALVREVMAEDQDREEVLL